MTEKEITRLRAEQFPQLSNCIYLANCRMGIPPVATLNAVRNFIDGQGLRKDGTVVNPHEGECIREAAKLIHAGEAEIGFLRSTSEGIGAFSFMLNLRAGDSVILNDLEFMSNVIPWKIMEKNWGIQLKIIHHKQGRILASDIEAVIDERTRAIAISSVQEVNGFRCDIEKIGEIAARENVRLMVDAIQHLGALPMDVKKCKVDILVAGGHKWLLSPFGAGFFYVRKDLIPQMEPAYLGWRSVEENDWKDFDQPNFSPIRDYTIRNDSAKKFMIPVIDIIPGIPALWASLRFINEIGINEIEERIRYLGSLLIEELNGEVDIVSPLEEKCRSAILTVRTQDDRAIVQRLAERDMYVSVAYASGTGGVRIAPNFFNTTGEIIRFSKEFKRIYQG